MPRYTEGDLSVREAFLSQLQVTMVGAEGSDAPLDRLARSLSRGLDAGKALVPYFAGIDWNVENVLMDGTTPVLVDGFCLEGGAIQAAIERGAPVDLSRDEVEGYRRIPYFHQV